MGYMVCLTMSKFHEFLDISLSNNEKTPSLRRLSDQLISHSIDLRQIHVY